MPKPDHARPSEPRAERAELVRLVRRIQAVTLELQEPRRSELDHADVEANERLLRAAALATRRSRTTCRPELGPHARRGIAPAIEPGNAHRLPAHTKMRSG
jgi:hypothetical protein